MTPKRPAMQLALVVALSAAGVRAQTLQRPSEASHAPSWHEHVTTYDDLAYHIGAAKRAHLPKSAGATHMGLFLAWAVMHDLVDVDDGDEPDAVVEARLTAVKRRKMKGTRFLKRYCGDRLWSKIFTMEGRAFADSYYQSRYLDDYEKTFSKVRPTPYHVPDTWKSYDKLAPVIDARFEEWKVSREKKTP